MVPPASTVTDGLDLARSMASAWMSNAAWSMTAPMNVDRSDATSPMVRDSTVPMKSSFIRFHTLRGTYAREAAEHFWPWYSNAPRTSAVRRTSGSADGCAITKSLPPVSPTSRG